MKAAPQNAARMSALLAAALLSCSPLLKSADGTFAEPDGSSDAGASELRAPEYLKAPPGNIGAQAWFGYALAVSGSTVAVTAPLESVSGKERAGAVHVFDLNRQEPSLRFVAPNADVADGTVPSFALPAEAPANEAWTSLHAALGDAYVAVGVASESSGVASDPSDNSAPAAGAVYVHDRAAPEALPLYLKAREPHTGDLFGGGIAIDGSLLAVGAPGENGAMDVAADAPLLRAGAVHVYELHDGRAEEMARLTAPNGKAGDYFGTTLALSPDLLVIGAPTEDGGGTGVDPDMTDVSAPGAGAVYVYRRMGDIFEFESYLKPSEPVPSSGFGYSVSVSGDRVAVGQPGTTRCDSSQPVAPLRGAAYVFSRASGTWKLERCLSPNNLQLGVVFGWSVAIASDRLLVGAPWDSSSPDGGGASLSGAAYLFERRGGAGWLLHDFLKAPNTHLHDVFGNAVALSTEVAVVGAPRESSGAGTLADEGNVPEAAESGAAYAYRSGVRAPLK